MIKKGSQIVCESLLREGCNVVFGIPGGAILPLYQALPEYPELRHILTRHEQGASLATPDIKAKLPHRVFRKQRYTLP
jgi:thiamine pyrophosphate-dependent acetolactate synthase large subunit-like protein